MSRYLTMLAVLAVPVTLASCAVRGTRAEIELTSSAFDDQGPIPKKYTGDGEDVSPPLAWQALPQGTRELALICDDPDAPGAEPWVHWVIYKIPASASGLAEGVAPQPDVASPVGALQGSNSWTSGQTIGYRGPAPPPGKTHHYRFRIYALDAPLDLPAEVDKRRLLEAMQDHVLGEGLLTGTYRR